MATMARDTWTDERLDDLNAKVDRLDQRMDAGFAETREEIRAGRAETREEIRAGRADTREEIRAGHDEMREEIRAARAATLGEIKAGHEEFGFLRSDMREIRTEMGALNRTIHQFMASIVAAILLGFFGTIAALISLA